MGNYVTKEAIRMMRTRKNLTQEQLAAKVGVTAKAVSKWETGRGLPDISLLEPLAEALGVSIAELITGDVATNENRSANLKQSVLYVCPICGNVIWTLGGASVSCCGVSMVPLEPERDDDEHVLQIERIDAEHVVAVSHPMTKDHYVSFIAAVNDNEVRITKLYPEQDAFARFSIRPGTRYYAYCNRHGLFESLPARAVRSNEKKHGAEARKRYGNKAVDEANERIATMDDAQWGDIKKLEHAIIEQLKAVVEHPGDAEAAATLCQMHERWIRAHWGKEAYSRQAHLGLAQSYLCDQRFVEYYDSRAGQGATETLVEALTNYCS